MSLKNLNTPVVILVVFAFLIGIIKHLILFYLPVIYTGLGFSALEIGLIMGLSLLAYILFSTPIGILCDRYSIRGIFAGAVILWIIFFSGMSITNSAGLAIILIFFFRIANLTGGLALTNILLKIEHKFKNRLIGTYNFLMMLGVVIGMLSGGYLLNTLGVKSTFLAVGVGLIPLLALSFILPKTKRSREKLKSYKQDIFSRKFVILALVLFLFSLHFGAENVSYALFLKTNLHLNFEHIGMYMATAVFFAAFVSLLAGFKTNKENTIKLFTLGLLLSGFGHILMVQNNVYLSLLFRIIHEIGDALYGVTFIVLVKDIFHLGRVGGNYGAFTALLASGAITGSIIFSVIGGAYGYQWPLIISGGTTLIGATVLLLGRKTLESDGISPRMRITTSK